MVEHLPRDPQVVPLEEPRPELPSPQGPCLVCGEWIDADTEDVYAVVVSDGRGRANLAAHARCLTSVTHPSVSLPG